MSMAKKAAAKTAAAKKTSRFASRVMADHEHAVPAPLPKGFTAIQSGLVPYWSVETEPVLQGRVESFGLIKATKKGEEDRPSMIVVRADGTKATVGSSHAIRALFGNPKVKKGTEVYFQFLGIKKLKGKRTMRDVVAGYK